MAKSDTPKSDTPKSDTPKSDGRTPEQIRQEIGVERAGLEESLGTLKEDALKTVRIARSTFGGLGLLFALRKLRRRGR